MIEVIVQNGTDAKQAEELGASRLELVSAIQEGGLTPSYGTMKQVINSVSLPVYVMIRPHSQHFLYGEKESEIMQEDIKQLLELGGNKVVFGALNEDYTINEELLKEVIAISPKLEITFHRAFDEVSDQQQAYQTLAKYDQVKWILTSGGVDTCEEGKTELRELVTLSKQLNGPEIMPGTGLSVENIATIHEAVQANQYHFGKAVRKKQSFEHGFDEQAIEAILNTITK